MASSSNTTKDHDEIRNWAEERGGKPAHVADTGSKEDIGILRIEFPGAPASNDSKLEEISWEQFFEKFDERGLALLYQEQTAAGVQSNFNRLVSSETAEEAESGGHSESGSAAKKTSGRSRKPPAKKSAGSTAAKKTAPGKTAPGKTVAPKKAAPAKKLPAKKAVPAKKAAPAKKTAPAKKSAPAAKKAAKSTPSRTPAKKSPAKSSKAKRPAVKKTSARRGSR